MTKTRETRTVLGAFMERRQNIIDLLNRLQRYGVDDHFGAHPDEINWGHVGDLNDIERQLRELNDRVFREGEYAPENIERLPRRTVR